MCGQSGEQSLGRHSICLMDNELNKTRSAIQSHDEHALLPPFHTHPDRRDLVRVHSGDFTHQETHVPIPNTTVKLMGPTIVPKGVKIGHCRELLNTSRRAIFVRCFSFGNPVFARHHPDSFPRPDAPLTRVRVDTDLRRSRTA